MRRGILSWMVLLAAVLGPALAHADDDDVEDTGSLAAVQHRKFRMQHELQVAAATLPLDAFYKGVGGEVGYTWHFSDHWGWEVLHGGYSYALDTGLKQQLQTDFGVAPTAFEVAQYYANSDIVLKPFYGKASFFNSSVVHGEAFILGGGGIFKMTSGIDPAANLGLGGRIYFTQHISLRVDGREYLVFLQSPKSVIGISLGLSFDFGGDD